ncbi:hypothetical protein [Haloparvum sedimenti]|uniref:hypothetical protein n=1 Tax=Haloparvum sedimenti TaxID=1678448 RepID=UPI00071E7818|nr:hypothetical protein [Haloparvum sedimenti]
MTDEGRDVREHASADVAPELYATDGGAAGDADAAREENAGDDDHLDDLPEGAGCTEIWEHLSERREE